MRLFVAISLAFLLAACSEGTSVGSTAERVQGTAPNGAGTYVHGIPAFLLTNGTMSEVATGTVGAGGAFTIDLPESPGQDVRTTFCEHEAVVVGSFAVSDVADPASQADVDTWLRLESQTEDRIVAWFWVAAPLELDAPCNPNSTADVDLDLDAGWNTVLVTEDLEVMHSGPIPDDAEWQTFAYGTNAR